jgi:hypothetical protein
MRHGPVASCTLILVLAGWAAPATSAAQEATRTEVFGGYAWARDAGRQMNGWDVTVTLNLREWIGVSTDVSGLYASLGNTDRSRYSVLLGPTVSTRFGRFTPFAHALVGAFHTRSHLEFLSVSIAEGFTDPGMGLGGGVKIRLFDGWVGAVKVESAIVRSRGRTDADPRVFGGLVFGLGGGS